MDPFTSKSLRSEPQGPVLLPVRILRKERSREYGKLTIEIDYGTEDSPLIRKYVAGVIFDQDTPLDARETIWDDLRPEASFVLRPVTIGTPVGDYLPTAATNGNIATGVSSLEFIHINGEIESLLAFFTDKDMVAD